MVYDATTMAQPLASPAMGHWGTCRLDFQLINFGGSLTSQTLTIRAVFWPVERFYRAKRNVARYCHDKLSVCPSVCDVDGLWSHALEFRKNNSEAD